MHKKLSFLLLALILLTPSVRAAEEKSKRFEASGEVVEVEPLYGRITIKHGAIKGFSGGPETEFVAKSSELLKNLSKRDLVYFVITEEKGNAEITEIKKTGEAPPKEEGLELGRAVQGVLTATGEAARIITSPIPPAHDVVSAATSATTDTTETVLDSTDGPEVKHKF